jgi:hypothetical protein
MAQTHGKSTRFGNSINNQSLRFTTMFVCIDHCSCVTLAGSHGCRRGSRCVVDWRHILCAADAVLPLGPSSSKRFKYSAFVSKDIRSSNLVVACFHVCPGLLLAIHSPPLTSTVPSRARLRVAGEVMPACRGSLTAFPHRSSPRFTLRCAVTEPPVLLQVIVAGEQVITAAMNLSSLVLAVESEDDGQDCESHHHNVRALTL